MKLLVPSPFASSSPGIFQSPWRPDLSHLNTCTTRQHHSIATIDPAATSTSISTASWFDTERGITSARQTSRSLSFSQLSIFDAMTSLLGSPTHMATPRRGSSQIVSSSHGFEQDAAIPCCSGLIPANRLRFPVVLETSVATMSSHL